MSSRSSDKGSANRVHRSPRIEGRFEAVLVDEAGRDYPVVVRDISRNGFRFECAENFKAGERAALRVARYGDFPVEIRWSLGNESGGIFLEPVTL